MDAATRKSQAPRQYEAARKLAPLGGRISYQTLAEEVGIGVSDISMNAHDMRSQGLWCWENSDGMVSSAYGGEAPGERERIIAGWYATMGNGRDQDDDPLVRKDWPFHADPSAGKTDSLANEVRQWIREWRQIRRRQRPKPMPPSPPPSGLSSRTARACSGRTFDRHAPAGASARRS